MQPITLTFVFKAPQVVCVIAVLGTYLSPDSLMWRIWDAGRAGSEDYLKVNIYPPYGAIKGNHCACSQLIPVSFKFSLFVTRFM